MPNRKPGWHGPTVMEGCGEVREAELAADSQYLHSQESALTQAVFLALKQPQVGKSRYVELNHALELELPWLLFNGRCNRFELAVLAIPSLHPREHCVHVF